MQQLWHRSLQTILALYFRLLRPKPERVRGIILHGNQLLMVRHVGGSGAWTLPGGGRKPSETWPQALEREIHEELKLSIHANQEVACKVQFKKHRALTTYYLLFATPVNDKALRLNRLELLDAAWFLTDETPSDITPVAVVALELIATIRLHKAICILTYV